MKEKLSKMHSVFDVHPLEERRRCPHDKRDSDTWPTYVGDTTCARCPNYQGEAADGSIICCNDPCKISP